MRLNITIKAKGKPEYSIEVLREAVKVALSLSNEKTIDAVLDTPFGKATISVSEKLPE